MCPLTRDDFIPEEGLFDDADATITDVLFGPTEKYVTNTGEKPNLLNLVLEDELLEKPITQGYSLGGAMLWQTTQDGSEVVSGKKPNAHAFMKSSRAYSLVESIFKAIGNGEVAKGQEDLIQRGFYMTQRGFYVGIRCHWKRIKLPQVTGGESDVLLAEKFLGFVDLGNIAVTQPGTVTAPSANGNVDGFIDQIVAMAQGKDERGLKMAIMNNATLKANTVVTAAVFNKGLLKDLVQKGKLAIGPDGKFI